MRTNVIDIRSLRKTRGLTQEGLGMLCGMGKSQISRMEKGKLGSPETYRRVLEALQYNINITVTEKPNNALGRILDTLKLYLKYNGHRYGIKKLGVFGSQARNEATEDSDIDICIQLESPSLFKYAEITDDLSGITGKKIDLVSLGSKMTPEFRRELEKDVIYVQ